MKEKNIFLKYILVIFFFISIFIFPILTLLTSDKNYSEIENKVLTRFPKLSFDTIVSKSFMKDFDNYSSDQFPLRSNFIKIRNIFSYTLGLREFRNIYVGKNGRLMEKFIFNPGNIDKNISQATLLSKNLYQKHGINSKMMIIPNSIAFYEDDLPEYAVYDDQKTTLDYIENKLKKYNDFIEFYTPYDVLEINKDKYIYFNTDHHWTQLGAYIAYNDMFKKNNDINYGYEKVSTNFLGSYYSKTLLPNAKNDSIYSYSRYRDFKISMDFDKHYDFLYDNNKLNSKNKYQYFLHGDPAIAVINGNNEMNDEVLVIKDSYAHNFIPFLTNDYKKIHIIDPRYYDVDMNKYLSKNSNIKEVIYINNLYTCNFELINYKY